MTVLDILYTILIGPIQLIFEVIFTVAERLTGHPGIAIIALSLIMNFLVLPLYRRADIMQEEARDIELKLQKGVAHIKKNFTGDERMMMLQTYYRQNNYKPTEALNGSVSLLLEIPFFIAAYQFLSHLEILKGVSLGPIVDLSAPDGILVLGGVAINILPVLMTIINIISSALYLKGFPLKTKIQLYSMALLFLVFLYTSPSGLVFYWTLNNIFSLFKNIFYKLKEPEKILSVLASISGVIVVAYSILYVLKDSIKGTMFLVLFGLCLQIPLMLRVNKIKKIIHKISRKISNKKQECDKKIFFLCSLFLTVFIGILIPSAVIAASPMEFMDVNYNPLWYLVSSVALALGIFLVWLRVFYWLASDNGKVIFDKTVWIFCGIAIVNYMFFGTELGTLFAELRYESGMQWGIADQMKNLGVLMLVAAVFLVFINKFQKNVSTILITVILTIGVMVGTNVYNINKGILEYETLVENNESAGVPYFKLSKTGKNVIVFMLDRAMNQYVPYMFNEKPELQKQFEGFTYYSNTISHGGFTNFGTPGLFGGYEYIPTENNKRSTESLEEKQNEALKVMPTIFCENDFEVTVCDPPYAGYTWVPDLSIYDDLPEVNAYITQVRYNDPIIIDNRKRNFFCFSIMKSMPVFIQEWLYDDGKYNQIKENSAITGQEIIDNYTAVGLEQRFLDKYDVLVNLSKMTHITEEDSDTFLMMSNDTTHEPVLLQEPEYEPSASVDNKKYSATNTERYTVNGKKMKMDDVNHIIHYQANMAAFIQLGKWFDYMRENGVFDNTRIILVADHGRPLMQFDELILDDGSDIFKNVEFYYPLLMVKDFNSQDYQVSDEFMTNADVPTIAMKDIIDNPVNPFTGNVIDSSAKLTGTHYIIASEEYDVLINNGNTFNPSGWLTFNGDNIWDKSNWSVLEKETVNPEQN